MNCLGTRLDGDLDVVQAGIHQLADIALVGEAASVRVQARDLPEGFCVRDQLGQVGAKSGLSTGEHDVGNAQLPESIENPLP